MEKCSDFCRILSKEQAKASDPERTNLLSLAAGRIFHSPHSM
jgi:hypothetical protein